MDNSEFTGEKNLKKESCYHHMLGADGRSRSAKRGSHIKDIADSGFLLQRRAQIAETMTWTVATVIIIVLTFLFIFFTGTIAESKGVRFQSALTPAFHSDVRAQQELFALLEFQPEGKSVRMMIEQNDERARSVVEGALAEMERLGRPCGFLLSRVGERGVLMRLGRGEAAESAKVILGDKEVMLQCGA